MWTGGAEREREAESELGSSSYSCIITEGGEGEGILSGGAFQDNARLRTTYETHERKMTNMRA